MALLSYGTRLAECLQAADQLERAGPLDHRRRCPLRQAARPGAGLEPRPHHEALITVEEGSIGGFGSFVLHALADAGLLSHGLKLKTLTLPDLFQDHDTQGRMYAQAGLDAASIVETALRLCRPSLAAARSASAGAVALRLVQEPAR